MCQSKADGGRRCPSSSPAVQRARRVLKKRFQPPSEVREAKEDISMLRGKHIDKSRAQLAHLTLNQKVTLELYTDQEYTHINRLLYDEENQRRIYKEIGDEDRLADYETMINTLDSVFEKIPDRDEPQVLYRSFRPPVAIDKAADWAKENYAPGEVVSFPTYLSTSALPNAMMPMLTSPVYSSWGLPEGTEPVLMEDTSPRNTVFEIRTKKGVAVSSLSHMPQEQEELLPRGMKFRVVGVREGVTYRTDQHLIYGKDNSSYAEEKKTRVIFLEDVEEE